MIKTKSRLVNTRFWDDTYTSNLDPIEKLLFLYFLTNPLTNLIGVYEIEIRRIAFDTGIDKDMVLKILERFTKDKKIFYFEGYIVIKNFVKFQNEGSEKIKTGIKNLFDALPENIKKFNSDVLKGIDTLSYNNINNNINNNTNSNNNFNLILNKDIAEKTPQNNFINMLINIFSKEYLSAKGVEYFEQAQDKKAIARLLASYKKKNKDADTNKTILDFTNLFKASCNINDDKYLSQISISFLNSQINKYLNYLRNGKITEVNSGNNKGFDPRKNTWFTGTN